MVDNIPQTEPAHFPFFLITRRCLSGLGLFLFNRLNVNFKTKNLFLFSLKRLHLAAIIGQYCGENTVSWV